MKNPSRPSPTRLLHFFPFLGAKKAKAKKPRKERKKLAKPFRWQAASEDVEIFLFSPFKSMCCMIYERYNCFQKHYIFIKRRMNECTGKTWVQTSAWDEGMAAEISFVEICAKMGNKKRRRRAFTLSNCFYFIPSTEKHTPCHHMMYVEKSPFSGNERWHNVCHTYETHFRVNNLKLNPLTCVAGWESADPGGTTLPQYIICDNWMRFER